MAIIRWNRGALGKRRHAFLGFSGSGLLHSYTSLKTEILIAGVISASLTVSGSLSVTQGVVFLTRPGNSFVKLPRGRTFVKLPKLRDLKISA